MKTLAVCFCGRQVGKEPGAPLDSTDDYWCAHVKDDGSRCKEGAVKRVFTSRVTVAQIWADDAWWDLPPNQPSREDYVWP